MVLGTALVLAALSLFIWNRNEEMRAGQAAEQILPRLTEQIEDNTAEGNVSPLPDPYDPAMPETEIDGYAYIGYLSIPALQVELPVMSQWDYARLKIAPCRYAGSTKTDDLVICAHNYAWHFGRIGELAVGDEVYFTDVDGIVSRYTVTALETLLPTAVDEMAGGNGDLTLFTCTYGGKKRVTVRCDRIREW